MFKCSKQFAPKQKKYSKGNDMSFMNNSSRKAHVY